MINMNMDLNIKNPVIWVIIIALIAAGYYFLM
jgi:hypothetical protein